MVFSRRGYLCVMVASVLLALGSWLAMQPQPAPAPVAVGQGMVSVDEAVGKLRKLVDDKNVEGVVEALNKWPGDINNIPDNINLNFQDLEAGWTPLHVTHKVSIARFLIARGISVDVIDTIKNTPLHCAAELGHMDVAQLLLDRGADKEARNNDGATPLHVAIIEEHKAVVQILIARGAVVDDKAKELGQQHHIDLTMAVTAEKDEMSRATAEQQPLKHEGEAPEQETKYPCVIIIINDGGRSFVRKTLNDPPDSTMNILAIALAQAAAPIIVTTPVLRQFLLRKWARETIFGQTIAGERKDARDILERELARGKSGSAEDAQKAYQTLPYGNKLCMADWATYLYSLISFDDTSWNVYENSHFYLLVPKRLEQDYGRYLKISAPGSLPVKSMADLKTDLKITTDEENQPIVLNLDELKQIFVPKSGKWCVYLEGHGMMARSVAGMPIVMFRCFLDFLSTQVSTAFLFYSTCFGGGVNLALPYFMEYQRLPYGMREHPFIIAQNATTEYATYGLIICPALFRADIPSWYRYALCWRQPAPEVQPVPETLKDIKVAIDFKQFFATLRSILKLKTDAKPVVLSVEEKKFSLDPWRCVLNYVVPLRVGHEASDTPLIKFPGTSFFSPMALGPDVMALTETMKRAQELAATKKLLASSIEVKDRKVLLFYPSRLHAALEITGKMPEVVSMNPEGALHVIDELKAPSFSCDDVLRGVIGKPMHIPADIVKLLDLPHLPTKLWVIKRLVCQDYAGSGLDVGENVSMVIENVVLERAVVSELVCKRGDQYYRAIVATKKDEGVARPILFSPTTKEGYDEFVRMMLNGHRYTTVRMHEKRSVGAREVRQLVAPWQADPEKLINEIAAELGVALRPSAPLSYERSEAEGVGEATGESSARPGHMPTEQERRVGQKMASDRQQAREETAAERKERAIKDERKFQEREAGRRLRKEGRLAGVAKKAEALR